MKSYDRVASFQKRTRKFQARPISLGSAVLGSDASHDSGGGGGPYAAKLPCSGLHPQRRRRESREPLGQMPETTQDQTPLADSPTDTAVSSSTGGLATSQQFDTGLQTKADVFFGTTLNISADHMLSDGCWPGNRGRQHLRLCVSTLGWYSIFAARHHIVRTCKHCARSILVRCSRPGAGGAHATEGTGAGQSPKALRRMA